MTDTPRSWKRPVEEVARAICCPEGCNGVVSGAPIPCDIRREDRTSIGQAEAVLDHLTALGFLTIECLEAIKAEQEGMK